MNNLQDEEIESFLDFDIPSGSEVSFCDSDDMTVILMLKMKKTKIVVTNFVSKN